MAEISKIKLPSGQEYDIKDATAREMAGGAIRVKGATTTALSDESTTNPITISGDSYTAVANDAVFYDKKEYVFDGTKWHEFGDMSGLGALAYKDNGSVSVTAAGSVSTSAASTSSAHVTAAAPTSDSSFDYQPSGVITQPTISIVGTGGSTTTVKGVKTVNTVVTGVSAYQPIDENESEPAGAITCYSVTGETLSLYGLEKATGASVETEDATVKSGDASYTASGAAFTGDKKNLTVSVPSTFTSSFTGSPVTANVTFGTNS